MGVQDLLTFLKSSELGERVKLSDIAAEYRKNTGKQPVLLVDSFSCLPYIHSCRNLFPSAQLKKFKENCQKFLNQFHDLGIRLFIIEDGLKSQVNIQQWIKYTQQVVETLNLVYSKRKTIPAIGRAGHECRIAEEVFTSSNKCEFHRSIYEASHYIAQYLKQNGAFGVLSNDSDVILMEGSHYFLSIEDLNLSEMTTFNFNRDKLAEFLEIKAQLLPHVGILYPNDVLNLDKFVSKYCKNTAVGKNFKAVADVVKQYLFDFDAGDYSPKELKYYQSELCLDEPQLEKYVKRLRILNGQPDEEPKVVENRHWNRILGLSKILHRGGRTDRRVLELLLGKKFFCGIELESVLTDTPGEKLQYLRRKIYGFLFSEYPERAPIIEYSYFGCSSASYYSRQVTSETRDHVGLLELWSADIPYDIQKKKYKYFLEIINEKLHPDILLGKVGEEFIFPLLAVFYLQYELRMFKDPTLMNVFLIHSILANKLSASEMADFNESHGFVYGPYLYRILNFDLLNLCGWYLKVIDHLELVNSVCGHPFDRSKTNIVNYFDGLLLQSVLMDVNGGKVMPDGVLPTFKLLKKVLFEMKECCGF